MSLALRALVPSVLGVQQWVTERRERKGNAEKKSEDARENREKKGKTMQRRRVKTQGKTEKRKERQCREEE